MTDRLTLAALASVLALATLCLDAPAFSSRGADAAGWPVAVMADLRWPAIALP